ncbi:heme NO-binding domain-containing protein [Neptunicoccus sediminis]|uniref:heme NO-binding domain-containing protein n=1 Tax=Neptunicoccus sediminis TaxID=1892596 RepID=UPI000845D842|nr:heme NO-binding domain-containing protein [Neptunicoccus sediminis]
MHGTINCGLQVYVCEIFGPDIWEDSCARAGLSGFSFETMLTYDDALTERLLTALTQVLGRDRADLLEDFGTFVVSEDRLKSVRKLLRFGGESYVEFLQSLEDVHDRAKIALPDLDVPRFELETHGGDRFTVHYKFEKLGFGAVFLGLLRGMADDYGALILIDHIPVPEENWDKDRFEISMMKLSVPDALQDPRAISL